MKLLGSTLVVNRILFLLNSDPCVKPPLVFVPIGDLFSNTTIQRLFRLFHIIC